MTTTTLVETGEEDPVLAVARFTAEVAWAKAGPEVAEAEVSRVCEEAETLSVESRWSELVSLLLAPADLVLGNAPEKDSEAVFTVITNLVNKARSPDEALAMADQIALKATNNASDKAALRLRILFNLYNVLDNSYGRFLIYSRAVDFAVNGKVTEVVIPSFKRMDAFLKEWNIGTTEKRKLFLAITNILKDGKGSGKDSFSFLMKYLATFSGEDPQTLAEAKEEAVRAIIEFVKAADMFQCDLLDMPAVRQLEDDPKYSPVYRLLEIFLTSQLNAYLEFQSANPNVLKAYGLVHDDCISKMRLMSLAGLASQATREISYATIMSALQVNEDEVEHWIVKGIATKMMDAKMDQMNQIVVISRSAERVFGAPQWRELRDKLAVWKLNISNVTRTIENAKLTNGVPAALQAVH